MFDGPITTLTFNGVHFGRNPFTCACEGGVKKSLDGFQFCSFSGRFSSDGAASVAVKGLITDM